MVVPVASSKGCTAQKFCTNACVLFLGLRKEKKNKRIRVLFDARPFYKRNWKFVSLLQYLLFPLGVAWHGHIAQALGAKQEPAVRAIGCQVGCLFQYHETLLKEFCLNRHRIKGLRVESFKQLHCLLLCITCDPSFADLALHVLCITPILSAHPFLLVSKGFSTNNSFAGSKAVPTRKRDRDRDGEQLVASALLPTVSAAKDARSLATCCSPSRSPIKHRVQVFLSCFYCVMFRTGHVGSQVLPSSVLCWILLLLVAVTVTLRTVTFPTWEWQPFFGQDGRSRSRKGRVATLALRECLQQFFLF